MGCLFDDFYGESPDTEDLSIERLLEIYTRTVEELLDPRGLTPDGWWRDQLTLIEEELAARDEARLTTELPVLTFLKGKPLRPPERISAQVYGAFLKARADLERLEARL